MAAFTFASIVTDLFNVFAKKDIPAQIRRINVLTTTNVNMKMEAVHNYASTRMVLSRAHVRQDMN